MKKIYIFDTTLRDGAQSEGISLSLDDKIRIALKLDEFGIDYIEGGWPGSNPKDEEFFKKIRNYKLKHSKIVAFGSTRRKDITVWKDENIKKLLHSKTPVICIFGKSWDLHVIHALRTTLNENLNMIYDSVKFFKSKNKEVIYDAEHFFDGFKNNKEYAIQTIIKAQEASADNITLCDTNGGTLPDEIREIISEVKKIVHIPLGIHAHNDSDTAVANSIVAVKEGCVLVQGTINGYGERCGNTNLSSLIPNLQIKLGHKCLPQGSLKRLTELSRFIDEVCNVISDTHKAYVGRSAFAHKGGIHVSAMARHTKSYEHIDPKLVGNERRILLSELSGRANLLLKSQQLNLDLKDNIAIEKIISVLKNLENKGYEFESAEASFSLIIAKYLKRYKKFFDLKGFRVIVEKDPKTNKMTSEATIKLEVNGCPIHTAAEGDGPVHALDNALRKALLHFYPQLSDVSLTDFKVRVIDAKSSTAAKVRVLIESRDKDSQWGTIGVSENIIEASWQALVDALEYKLLKQL